VNWSNGDMRHATALHVSAVLPDASLSKILLEHRAQVDARDSNGLSALHFASAYLCCAPIASDDGETTLVEPLTPTDSR